MSLFQTLRTDALEARKARQAKTASTLTTLIGELETFGKNAGREPTDADVVAFVKKALKNVDETLKVLHENDDRQVDLVAELGILGRYLPQQLTEAELRQTIEDIIATIALTGSQPMVGDVMKALKTNFNGQYDGALASSILKARFGR